MMALQIYSTHAMLVMSVACEVTALFSAIYAADTTLQIMQQKATKRRSALVLIAQTVYLILSRCFWFRMYALSQCVSILFLNLSTELLLFSQMAKTSNYLP